jgi:uncharacterized protein YjbI with pentapeptide repeats
LDNLIHDKHALKEFEDTVLKICPSFLDPNDPLRIFLDAGGAKYLRSIRNMEEHRRALGTVDLEFESRKNSSRLGTSSSYLLMLLRKENITEFNTIRKQSNFPNLDLSEADIGGRDMRGADLRKADLTKAYLAGANLSHANLSHAFLSHARLERSDLSCANLEHAYLHDAKLIQSNLQEANLVDAILSSANLHNAKLHGADMKNALLSNVVFDGADLEDVKNLPISKEEALSKRARVESRPEASGWD